MLVFQKYQSSATAENVLAALKQRYGGGSRQSHSCPSNAALKSLELLRENIQGIFDKEIDTILKKFIEMFFVPAIKNIRDNLGESSINDDLLKRVYCNLLDHAKNQYTTQSCSVGIRAETPGGSEVVISDSDSNADQNNPSPCAAVGQYTLTFKRKIPEQQSLESPAAKKTFILPLTAEAFQSPILSKQLLQETPTPPRPKPIVWNTSAINIETQFVLDIKVTRAFGMNEIKERLSTKHPELIRYLMDGNDKDWMVQQKIILPTNKNLKYLILVRDEVFKLAEQNPDYQRNLTNNPHEIQPFKVSEFILKKILKFFSDLNYKSRFNFFESTNVIPLMNSTPMLHVIASTAAPSSNTTTIPLLSTSSTSSVAQTSTPSSSASSVVTSRSILSSTHATLSALLSNHNESSVEINDN